ncbi:MAG: NAD(P)H-binding protein [Bacteroidota bacterium]
MTHNISILGCGWLGAALAEAFVKQGWQVRGSTRSAQTAPQLDGLTHFVVDIGAKAPIDQAFLAAETLIIAIPTKEISAFKGFIAQLEPSDVKQVLFISSTSVYPLTNDIVTEETATTASVRADIEQLFLSNSHFTTTVLRFGGLFGYKRQPGNFFKPGRIIDHPEGYVNMIHRDDCIGIILEMLRQNCWGEVLNACADTHPTRRDFYSLAAAKVGRSDLRFNEEAENHYKIVSSQKLKVLLGYEFKYGDLMVSLG